MNLSYLQIYSNSTNQTKIKRYNTHTHTHMQAAVRLSSVPLTISNNPNFLISLALPLILAARSVLVGRLERVMRSVWKNLNRNKSDQFKIKKETTEIRRTEISQNHCIYWLLILMSSYRRWTHCLKINTRSYKERCMIECSLNLKG